MEGENITGKRIAIIATDYFEEAELFEPLKALQNAGLAVHIIAPHDGQIKSLRHVEPGKPASVDMTLAEVKQHEYDALVVPGGALNADHLRMDEHARNFVRLMVEGDKPVAVICHGPWLLVSAGVVRGRKLTSYYTIQDDLRNAGADWMDQEVVVDGKLITSRKPADLPAFNRALLAALA